MSNSKETTGSKKPKKHVVDLSEIAGRLPICLKDVGKVSVVDETGKQYFLRVLSEIPEPDLSSDDTISVENLSSDLEDIKKTFVMLNDDQRDIIMHIYYLYKNKETTPEGNPKIILQGPAGAGKSTIINFIEKLITWEENKTCESQQNIKVLKCAYTGKAAVNIEGTTLHHIFSLPINTSRGLSNKINAVKIETLKNCVFFICDEISMVGEKTMRAVNIRLQQIFGNNKLYGDRFVLLVGDLYQLDPVKQKPLFPGSDLWTCCKFYELTKVIRQRDQNFINALNNFRDSKMSEDDVKLLQSREITDNDQVPDSVIHLFFRNNDVDDYNNKIISKSNEREVTVNCFEDCKDWRPSNLRLKIGIRYMITVNMDVSDGLANGTTGIVKDFHYDSDGEINVVWMEFHSNTIGIKARRRYWGKNVCEPGFENWVPIHRGKMTVTLKSIPKGEKKKSKTVPNMFPMKPAEAVTVHKSQGQTYHDGVCVHFTKHPQDKLRYDKSLQYVALTRATRIEDLYISGKFDCSVKKTTMTLRRKETEMSRLRAVGQLKLAFETFEDKDDDVIIYLNTGRTFYDNYEFIASDRWYGNASLLIFTETNTIETDVIEIPNFEIAFRSDTNIVERLGRGIICYKKPNKSLEFIRAIGLNNGEIGFSLFLFERSIYIIVGTKGCITGDSVNQLMKLVTRKKCIMFVGDSNANSSTVFLGKKKFKENLSCSTDVEGQNDMVFTRNYDISDNKFGYYQYIPAPHKPMYVKLTQNLNCKKYLNINKIFKSNDNEKPGTSKECVIQRMEID